MPPKERSSEISSEIIQSYDALIAALPGVERKGATVPYTSHNGHMFSSIDEHGSLRLRLSKEDLPAFLKKYKTEQPVAYGVLLKEYALIPRALLKKTAELIPYFRSSFDYVSSLKPKATTKPVKASKSPAKKSKK